MFEWSLFKFYSCNYSYWLYTHYILIVDEGFIIDNGEDKPDGEVYGDVCENDEDI